MSCLIWGLFQVFFAFSFKYYISLYQVQLPGNSVNGIKRLESQMLIAPKLMLEPQNLERIIYTGTILNPFKPARLKERIGLPYTVLLLSRTRKR